LVSAIISVGKPRELLRRGISKEFHIVTSDLILRELSTVLRRPKFKTDEDEIHRIILALMQVAEVVEVVSAFNLVKEDPKDDMVVETAYDGKADFVVSGDNHLLALKSYGEIKIVEVKEMLTRLEEKTV
jgi:putative PIN family toxin of toxin-antitoxin system